MPHSFDVEAGRHLSAAAAYGKSAPAQRALRALGAGAAADPLEIGAKAARFDALARARVAAPVGFALTAEYCDRLRAGEPLAWETLAPGVAALERETGLLFGDDAAPLLLCVRLSPATHVSDLAPAIIGVGAPMGRETSSELVVERAFWRTFAPIVCGVDPAEFDEALEDAQDAGANEVELTQLTGKIAREAGAEIASARDALLAACTHLAKWWASPRALRRRAAAQADERCALLVQMCVAPPASGQWGAGRLRLYDGETGAFAPKGRLNPMRFGDESLSDAPSTIKISSENGCPAQTAAIDLVNQTVGVLKGAQDVDFAYTVNEDGEAEAVLLTTQPQRVSAQAGLRIAVGRVESGTATYEDALLSVPAQSLEEMLHPTVDANASRELAARGIAASPGAASGPLALSSEEVENFAQLGMRPILACTETSPEDMLALHQANGVVTTRGGLTSHAAVVARGLGKPCVVGAQEARIEEGVFIAVNGERYRSGDIITVDGSAGEILAGEPALRQPELTGAFGKLMSWADSARRLRIRANADTPADAQNARRMGVDGLGLCRTEHMFFDPERIIVMREMIMADDEDVRRAAALRLLPMQRADFLRLFEIMGQDSASSAGVFGYDAPPVTIRLLDPPLHEFLPNNDRGMEALASALGQPVQKVMRRANELKELNPMLGKRGCRVGVAYPEIYEMQARAIFEAALEVERRTGQAQRTEIMIPLVSAVRELEVLSGRIDAIAVAVGEEQGAQLDYCVGIMVETPRAALRAEALGEISAFFSFGTNDLTQMTYGLSRDDAGRLMRDYVERGVFEADPFQSLDQDGVGELIQMAIDRGRRGNPELVFGLCGEHGGDPATIAFCHKAGFDYVSCSPYRAPIARLAAAQAAIMARRRADGRSH